MRPWVGIGFRVHDPLLAFGQGNPEHRQVPGLALERGDIARGGIASIISGCPADHFFSCGGVDTMGVARYLSRSARHFFASSGRFVSA